jgi:hypothetical protein
MAISSSEFIAHSASTSYHSREGENYLGENENIVINNAGSQLLLSTSFLSPKPKHSLDHSAESAYVRFRE